MLTIAPQIRNGVVAIALNISIAKAQWLWRARNNPGFRLVVFAPGDDYFMVW
jgi:hypothetical protein